MVADQAEPLLAAVAALHEPAGLADCCSTPSAQNSLQANRSPSTRHCRIRPSTTGNEFPHQAHFLNFERCDIAFLRRVGRTFRRILSEQHGVGRPRPRCWPSQNRGFSRGGGSRPAKSILVTASTSVRAHSP